MSSTPSVVPGVARHQVLSVVPAPERDRPQETAATAATPGAQWRHGHGWERWRRAGDEVAERPAHGPRGVVAGRGSVLSEVERSDVEALGAAVFHVSTIMS